MSQLTLKLVSQCKNENPDFPGYTTILDFEEDDANKDPLTLLFNSAELIQLSLNVSFAEPSVFRLLKMAVSIKTENDFDITFHFNDWRYITLHHISLTCFENSLSIGTSVHPLLTQLKQDIINAKNKLFI
jgi:hypothetical protein